MELILHIGAHRTGSTLIEQAITATLKAHPQSGVALWPPRRLRDIEGFQSAIRHFNDKAEPINTEAAQRLERLAARIAGDIREARNAGISRLILSEENLIGGMRQNLSSGEFYPDVQHRLACLDTLLPLSPLKIALGVREYAAVWTSAYHYLPQSGHAAPPARVARSALLGSRRGWPDVAAAAQAVWPDAELVMWQQEHLSDETARICARLTGLAEEEIVVPAGRVNARQDGGAGQALFDPDERKHLAHRYNRHLRRMRDAGTIRWIGMEAA